VEITYWMSVMNGKSCDNGIIAHESVYTHEIPSLKKRGQDFRWRKSRGDNTFVAGASRSPGS